MCDAKSPRLCVKDARRITIIAQTTRWPHSTARFVCSRATRACSASRARIPYNRGLVYEAEGDLGVAFRAYGSSLRLRPNAPLAAVALRGAPLATGWTGFGDFARFDVDDHANPVAHCLLAVAASRAEGYDIAHWQVGDYVNSDLEVGSPPALTIADPVVSEGAVTFQIRHCNASYDTYDVSPEGIAGLEDVSRDDWWCVEDDTSGEQCEMELVSAVCRAERSPVSRWSSRVIGRPSRRAR